MLKINKAKTDKTVTYYYDAILDRFLASVTSRDVANYGFKPTHKITIDAGLPAQEIDIIFDLLFNGAAK